MSFLAPFQKNKKSNSLQAALVKVALLVAMTLPVAVFFIMEASVSNLFYSQQEESLKTVVSEGKFLNGKYEDAFVSVERIPEEEVVPSYFKEKAFKNYHKDGSFFTTLKLEDRYFIGRTKPSYHAQVRKYAKTVSQAVFVLYFFVLVMVVLFTDNLFKRFLKNFIELKPTGFGDVDDVRSKMLDLQSKLLDKENQLVLKDECQNQFIHNISHDIKTPLSIISATSQLMKVDTMDEDNQVIQEEVENISGLLNKLTLVMDNNDFDDDVFVEDFKDEVEKIVRSFDSLANSLNRKIVLNFCEYAGISDRGLPFPLFSFKQVLNNYVHNAIKYAEDSEIEVSVVETSTSVLIEVTNQGFISEYDQARVFDLSFRSDKARTSRDGNGVGLFIVKEIAEKNHCDYGLTVADDEVCFYFEIEKHKKDDV